MTEPRPIGRRFTDVYREKGVGAQDSDKFRRRISHKLHDLVNEWHIISTLRSETGYQISGSPTAAFWLKFISDLSLDEFLDFLTITAQVFLSNEQNTTFEDWIKFCQRALDEENISFFMDHAGGIHYKVDQAFQYNKLAAMDALNSADSFAAREAFEEAQIEISSASGSTLTAVRRSFDAVENIFKLRFRTSRLGATEIKSKLADIANHEGTVATNAARRINESFAEWVNACHQYRHASDEPDPSPPPRWLAIALVDSSATYLRYLTSGNHK